MLPRVSTRGPVLLAHERTARFEHDGFFCSQVLVRGAPKADAAAFFHLSEELPAADAAQLARHAGKIQQVRGRVSVAPLSILCVLFCVYVWCAYDVCAGLNGCADSGRL